jgi:selenide,water dikinase
MKFDLLKTVEYGGCSAKLPADVLDSIMSSLHLPACSDLIVGTASFDDAAVYRINAEQAIIFTTDFFPPVCSDAYTFGQIAVANALSDVYAMGGVVLMGLNLTMFPAKDIPLEVLSEILRGGADKMSEAGGIIAGGHSIDDSPVKYGLAVVGMVHPDAIITNSAAKAGDVLILTKPIGTGTIMAGHRLDLISERDYQQAIDSMRLLNDKASEIMRKYGIKCATDVTGFSLLGHGLNMAKGSDVCINISLRDVPFMSGAIGLTEMGCIPGASFRNMRFVESEKVDTSRISYDEKMLLYDAQTSGGMLICVSQEMVPEMIAELREWYPSASVIGEVSKFDGVWVTLR